MRFLALDVSLTTGWACGSEWELTSGVWKLPRMKAGTGCIMSSMAACMERAIDTLHPQAVIYEAPLPANRQDTTAVARLLYTLCGVVEMICHERGDIPCTEASADEVRKLVLGKALRGDREMIKNIVTCWAIDQGHDPYDDNEADALLLHKYRSILGRSTIMAGAGSR